MPEINKDPNGTLVEILGWKSESSSENTSLEQNIDPSVRSGPKKTTDESKVPGNELPWARNVTSGQRHFVIVKETRIARDMYSSVLVSGLGQASGR